ncbi:MAG: hypothetical protein KF833_19735 [Verrucomicrobiae bacterium]|nr:hypothetical protein [Verrucomicrobiae bacterium]
MKTAACVVAVSLGWSALGQAPPEALTRWNLRSPNPVIWGIAEGPPGLVAVGGDGVVMVSPDGQAWSDVTAGTTNRNSLFAVTHAEDGFLAVGAQGVVLSSINGRDWVGRFSGTTNELRAISWIPGRGVIVGGRGTILVSPNGHNWTSIPGGGSVVWYGVAQGGGVAVAVGSGGAIAFSENFSDWFLIPSGTTRTLRAVGYFDGTFLAAGFSGTILTSTDGVVWRPQAPENPSDYYSVSRFEDQYRVAGGPGQRVSSYARIASSRTFTNWVESAAPLNAIVGLHPMPDQLLAVGAGGTIARSTDGLDWQGIASSPTEGLWGLSFVNGALHVGGSPQTLQISHSTFLSQARITGLQRHRGNGNWDVVPIPETPAFARAIPGGPGYVAVGPGIGLHISGDGVTWQPVEDAAGLALHDVAFSGSRWMAVGALSTQSTAPGVALTSTDGIAWERVDLPAQRALVQVAYGNGVFVATGAADVLSSPDGTGWRRGTPVPTAVSGDFGLLGIAFGNGRFVGVRNSDFAVSEDGVAWTEVRPTERFPLHDVAFGAGWFVGVGAGTGAAGSLNRVAVSMDGIAWSTHEIPTTNWLRRAAFLDGRFTAAGDRGTVMVSDPLPPMAPHFLAQPRGITVGSGIRVDLESLPVSSEPLTFQWWKDGRSLEGAVGARLVLEHPTPADSGMYHVVASNALGRTESTAVPVTILVSGPADHWAVVRYPGSRFLLDRFAVGAGVYVATTGDGGLVVSTNGIHWEAAERPGGERLISVRYLADSFVVVGEGGTLLRSSDGFEWVRDPVPTDRALHDVVEQAGTWLVVGESGTVLRGNAPDSLQVLQRPVTTDLNRVVWAPPEFVAVGNEGTILRSFDGSLWFPDLAPTTMNLRSVATSGPMLVAVGDGGTFLRSTDGFSWRQSLATGDWGYPDILDVVFLGDTFYAAGRGWWATFRGTANTTASSMGSLPIPSAFSSLHVAAAELYGAAGTALMQTVASGGWRPFEGPDNRSLLSLADRGDLMVAVGAMGTILRSEDGTDWTREESHVTTLLRGVAAGAGVFVAVGNEGTILRSLDGRVWDPMVSGVVTNLLSICHGAGRFVAVGLAGVVLVSDDGVQWTRRGDLPVGVSRVKYIDGRYWALSTRTVFTSADTVDWTSTQFTGQAFVADIERFDGGWILLENYGIRTSPDGADWTPLMLVGIPAEASRLARHAHLLAAVGSSDAIHFSANGQDWYPRETGAKWVLRDVQYLRGAFYAVGDFGVVVRSAPHAKLVARPGNERHIILEGHHGRPYRVEYREAAGPAGVWQVLPDPTEGPDGPFWRDTEPDPTPRIYRAVLDE